MPAPGTAALLGSLPAPPSGLELQLYPHLATGDGRAANNGWLLELPDPVTRITWGGAVSIAPRRFDEMGLANGDLVEVDAGHAKVVAPAYRHAGMHHDQVALPLGLGRRACGVIGDGVGPDAFPLRKLEGDRVIAAGLPVTLRRVGGSEALAFAQGSDVIDRDRRPARSRHDAHRLRGRPEGRHRAAGGRPLGLARARVQEGQVVDEHRPQQVQRLRQVRDRLPGREQRPGGRAPGHPRRARDVLDADRPLLRRAEEGGPPRAPRCGTARSTWSRSRTTLFEPMLCQHCENAPCETVCPFVATLRSEDGLNQQIYNRCVGTRYCANNCPFKVRRFNYWDYSVRQTSALFTWLQPRSVRHADLNTRGRMQMKNNPEVTVRSRGVMEKCSFCVQRVRDARARATREGRSKDRFADGEVVPACMESCPTGAIVFGDVNNPESRVRALAGSPRAMRLLEALGVKPAISYLTKVRNDKA